MTDELRYANWTIQSKPCPNGFVAECWKIEAKKPSESFEAPTRDEAINLAKAWCDENIPF